MYTKTILPTPTHKDPDAEVEPVLIPDKDLLDPESTPTFDEEGSTDAQGTAGFYRRESHAVYFPLRYYVS